DPFFTTKSTGNGLGLSSVYGILKAHQAGVKVESEPNVGTCFTLYFLAAKDSQIRLVGGTEKTSMRGGNETILLVDDEEAVLKAAAGMLATLGYRVVTANDGEAALRVFQERPHAIDLVLTDIAMPNLHGRAAAKAMRMVKPGQRFLFTSGYTDEQQIDALNQDGFQHFIGKPYSMIDLQAAIRASLDAQ
ncbi:TPA: hybrid sensor histidine kinase/response regulator, partial [Candidatus Sumerlaeota bacterium]|nr:hybrid sensor histidine kinase/response regulator [Candidatus Sumerlaeota bacterium]